MKKTLIIIITALLIVCMPSAALADEDDDIEEEMEDEIDRNIERTISNADLHEIESYYNAYAEELGSITGGVDLKTFITRLAKGGEGINAADVYTLIADALFRGARQSLPAVIQIIVIGLLFSIIAHFKPSFGESGVSKAAQTAQFVIVGAIMAGILMHVITISKDAIATMTTFTEQLFPLLIALLTALGGLTSAAILSPATVFLTTGITLFMRSFILPLIIVLMVFTMVSNFSTSIKLSGFCALIKSVIKWAIGICFTVFLGIVAIQGLLGSTFDGVTLKTAKYTIDKMVPIIGGMFSDTVDVLIACTLLIKNAVGIAGIFIIAGIIIAPVFAILAHVFLLRITSAVLEPVAGGTMGKFAADTADVLLLLFAAVLAAAAMFFITVAVIIGAGNTNIMLR